ncbi:MAG TPA: TolC family protein [Candidatus Binataceae bacterium]|nr:TolC family protein [Candidatus Binataceae bacterium]
MLETPSCFRILRAALVSLLAMALLQSCAGFDDRPELNPDRWAPANQAKPWQPPAINVKPQAGGIPDSMSQATIKGDQAYDLPALVDVALQNNPGTERTWSSAREAAAHLGAAQAPYYPQVALSSDNGYQRSIIQLPGSDGVLKQWQSDPTLSMTWTLLDFGRRESASDSARQRLFAANLTFNRSMQDVAFNTESAFYTLDAADGAVIAAEQNLKLAGTDFDAARQRVDLGLATQPELLLTKERVAQSRFDLANAQLMVHDAEAQLAVAVGVAASPPIRIAGLQTQAIPAELSRSVEDFIAQARRDRPDLAARVASVRASDADIRQARAQFFPEVGISAAYGENIWNFTFATPQSVLDAQPQYSAVLALRWDLFTGFKRINDLRAAERERDIARADLRATDIDIVAEMWRAYFELVSSRSKYAFAQSLIEASEESYAANLETYRQGLSTIVELLTAERDLAQARYTFISSKAELLTSYAAVIHAAGALQ